MNFSSALEYLKTGRKAARSSWGIKGGFIALQLPDEKSKMTDPYIYMDTNESKPNTPKSRFPWLPSQLDLLADDWVLRSKKPSSTPFRERVVLTRKYARVLTPVRKDD